MGLDATMRRGRAPFALAGLAMTWLAAAVASAQTTAYRLTDLTPWTDCYNISPCAEGWAINASGQVTGTTNTPAAGWPAFRGDRTSSELLDQLSSSFSLGWAINESGRITGYSYTESGDVHATVWDGTEIRDLGTLLGSDFAYGAAINDAGHVAGNSRVPNPSWTEHAFRWDGTTMTDLGTLGGETSGAAAINAAGTIAGWAALDEYFGHAVIWEGTTIKDLGTLGGPYGGSYAWDINASGQVTGDTTLPDSGDDRHAFFWNGSTMQDLGTLGGTESRAVAINDAGEVAGNSSVQPGIGMSGLPHAFLWNGVTLRDLGTLGGAASEATDLNDAGHVVGRSTNASGAWRPFLWDGVAMHDLQTLVDASDPLKPFVTLFYAWRINARGDIAAGGIDSRRPGNEHVFLMSAVSQGVVLEGFGPPLDPLPTLNVVQAGRAVPLRFRVTTREGAPVSGLTEVEVTLRRQSCRSLEPTARDRVERYAKQRVGLESLGRGRYQFNWKSRSDAEGCGVLSLRLPNAYDAAPAALSAYLRFRN